MTTATRNEAIDTYTLKNELDFQIHRIIGYLKSDNVEELTEIVEHLRNVKTEREALESIELAKPLLSIAPSQNKAMRASDVQEMINDLRYGLGDLKSYSNRKELNQAIAFNDNAIANAKTMLATMPKRCQHMTPLLQKFAGKMEEALVEAKAARDR